MSPPPRLFVKIELTHNQQIRLDSDQSHYAFKVMRLRAGDAIRLFNGRDGEWHAEIQTDLNLKLTQQLRPQPQPLPNHAVELWCPLLRPARSGFLVEKATELGVNRIRHILTARTRKTGIARLDRLERIMTEAAEQTERLDVPALAPPEPLADLLIAHAGRSLLFCDEAGDDPDALWGGGHGRAAPIAQALQEHTCSKPVILIGPEGGFTPDERTGLRQYDGGIPVSLGPNILRTETAGIAALSLWQALQGSWTP